MKPAPRRAGFRFTHCLPGTRYKRPQPFQMTAAFVANYPWWLQAQPLSGKKRCHQKYFLILAIIISHANMQTISGRNYCSGIIFSEDHVSLSEVLLPHSEEEELQVLPLPSS